MPHSIAPVRKNLLIGAVGLVPRFRLKEGGRMLLLIRNELEAHLERNQFLRSAPFKTVSLILCYGGYDEWEPRGKYKIDRSHNELHVAVQLEASRLRTLEADPDALFRTLRSAVIEVLQDVAANYALPYEFLDEVLAGAVPNHSFKPTPDGAA